MLVKYFHRLTNLEKIFSRNDLQPKFTLYKSVSSKHKGCNILTYQYTNILTSVDQLLIGTGLGLNFNEQGMIKDMLSYGIPSLNALVQIYLIPITTRAKSNIMYKICF